MRFEGYSIRGRLADREEPPAQDEPEPLPGPRIRLPAVAGQFYPGDKVRLNRELDALFADRGQPEPWAGCMVPACRLVLLGTVGRGGIQAGFRFPIG